MLGPNRPALARRADAELRAARERYAARPWDDRAAARVRAAEAVRSLYGDH